MARATRRIPWPPPPAATGSNRGSATHRLANAVRAAWHAGWILRRRQTVAFAAVIFLIQFAFRGGFSLMPTGVAWPYPVGTVLTGSAPEPYLFLVATPRIALTFALRSMLKWAILSALVGWAASVLQETACCKPAKDTPRRPERSAATGLLGLAEGAVAVVGATASCCGLLGVLAPAVAGFLGASLTSISPRLDGALMLTMAGLIVAKGWSLQAMPATPSGVPKGRGATCGCEVGTARSNPGRLDGGR